MSDALCVRRVCAGARVPTRGSAGAAGYDLYSCADCTVPARGRAVVPTGIAVALPAGTYGRVAPRSGLAARHGIDTGAGVVDADYRGEVRVVLFNHSDTDVVLPAYSRVAQLIVTRIETPPVTLCDVLPETARSENGFGSTGVF